MQQFPHMLAFQSVADAPVSVSALVTGLFDRLDRPGSELVLFDINRRVDIEPLLVRDPAEELRGLLSDPLLGFVVTVVANADDTSSAAVARSASNVEEAPTEVALGLEWPEEIYSLAHVALPFRSDDPIYGAEAVKDRRWIEIGHIALRGETGVLRVSPREMLRLRWNPFHPYVADRAVAWIRGAAGP